MSNAFNL